MHVFTSRPPVFTRRCCKFVSDQFSIRRGSASRRHECQIVGQQARSPTLVRKKSLAEEIATLDVMSFQTILLPLSPDDPRAKTFRYEGWDIITLKKEVERGYTIPEPHTAQEVIGYYARRIAEAVKRARASAQRKVASVTRHCACSSS